MGFWTVNICLRRCTGCTPRKPSSREGGGDKLQQPRPPNTSSPELLDLGRAQNAGPTESVPLRTTRVPEPEWLRPGRCMQPRAGLRRFRRSNLEPEQCGQGGHTHGERGQAQYGQDMVSTRQCYLFAASLPPHSATEQVSLKKVSTTNHLVLGWKSDTEETSKQKKLKQREPPWK